MRVRPAVGFAMLSPPYDALSPSPALRERGLASDALNHAGLAQGGDLRGGVAELLQNGVGVGADFRRWAAQRAGCFDEFDREAEHLDRAVAGMLLLQHHLLVEDLRVGENFREPHDLAARYTGGV